MKKIPIALISVISFSISFGQTNKMTEFENGLTESKEIIFADSILHHYNIVERMKFYKVPSVSIALINNGKIEWAKAYGFADVENKRLANTSTLYQAASISKSINALGIMKLSKLGKLTLNKDIRTYLKTWTFPDNEFSKDKTITLKNLLSHTAGLNVHGFIGYSTTDALPTINQILDGQRPANNEAVEPIITAGTQFEYSGGGTTIIRKILDDNISKNYDSLMQSLVLKPLKMTRSTFSQPLNSKYKNYAFAYDQEMKVVKGTFYIYPEQAAGGLWTTATDIAKYILSVQASLKNNKVSILSKSEAIEMLTPPLENSFYALGTAIDTKGGEKYFWHDGESYGYRALYYGSFATGKGVVILTNSYPNNGKPLIYEILNSIANTYGWKNFYNPIVRKLVAVPDTLLDKYAGEYFSETPEMKITITKKNNTLELTARRSEKMFATALDTFYLASSPNDKCTFLSTNNDGIVDNFEVRQGTKILIKAKKKK
ncbi:MAG: serine hydrolase [Bacteroidetes bacterium]|nr:serine hydrolase [Bacteroidota bacterium]